MRFLVKKSPDSFIRSINDEISSILNRNFDNYFPEYEMRENERLSMPVEISEKEGEYEIKAELPGVKKEDLDIDVDKNCLTINAKRQETSSENSKMYKKSEFRYGEFSRTVYFPEEINIEKTKAKLDNGILNVNAPKMTVQKQNTKKLAIE